MTKSSKMAKTGKALVDADAAIAEAVVPFRKSVPVRLISVASELGDQPQARAISIGVIALGLIRHEGRLIRAGARMLIAHEAATLAKNFVKRRIDRTRPRSRKNTESHKLKAGSNTEKEETSFPSGHSAGAAAMARAYSREFPEHRVAAYAGAGLIGIAQIPRCAHYLTDVGSGLAVGVAAEAVVDRLFNAVLGKTIELEKTPLPAS
nr:phosphatase PAP2 family protein [uncultured Sphingosinicella sp.]